MDSEQIYLDLCCLNRPFDDQTQPRVNLESQAVIPHGNALDQRAAELGKSGLGEFDAYHIAAAEAGGCDRLATCDDRFLKAARRNAGKIKVRVMNPVQLVSEADF